MKYFDYSALKNRKWTNEIINYVSHIREHKGRQQLFLEQKPEELKTLVEVAKRQSTEASNDIEGIKTSDARLIKLMNDKTTPKNRSEQEILGYRSSLNIIHENYEYISINKNYILQLHREMYQFLPNESGGKFKSSQNYITDTKNNETLFTPLEPYETEPAIESLCNEYSKAINEYNIDPLLVIPVFIHDFLCIHPFKDGNGRMSRLLTTLLLYKNGFVVGRYISLEKKIQISKDDYYNALSFSSENWHNGTNDDTPFVSYLLGTILSAYRDFEDRVNMVTKKTTCKEAVVNIIDKTIGKFTKTDILEKCPEYSSRSVEAALKELCDEKMLNIEKKGRSTFYYRIN